MLGCNQKFTYPPQSPLGKGRSRKILFPPLTKGRARVGSDSRVTDSLKAILCAWVSPQAFNHKRGRLTPLNPPLLRGEVGKSCSLPLPRGGLGWGQAPVLQIR